jgi:hypothetical protein
VNISKEVIEATLEAEGSACWESGLLNPTTMETKGRVMAAAIAAAIKALEAEGWKLVPVEAISYQDLDEK